MMSNKINVPFSPPDIKEEEIQEVARALRSGWITTGQGPRNLKTNCRICWNKTGSLSELCNSMYGNGTSCNGNRCGR